MSCHTPPPQSWHSAAFLVSDVLALGLGKVGVPGCLAYLPPVLGQQLACFLPCMALT